MRKDFAKQYLDCAILTVAILGLLFSHALMSFALVFMAVRTLFCDKSRLKATRKDVLWATLSLFGLYAVGLVWSENLSEGFSQLNKALPFLVVPLYFFTVQPLENRQRKGLFVFALLCTFVLSLWGLVRLFFCGYPDIASALPFGSHIRFALIVCIEIAFLMLWLLGKGKEISRNQLAVCLALIGYLVLYLFFSSSMTGIFILLLVVLPISLLQIRKRMPKRIFYLAVSVFSFAVLVFAFAVSFYAYQYYTPKNGTRHDCFIENGSYLYCSDCSDLQTEKAELEKGLLKHLNIPPDSLFHSGETSYPYTDIAYRYFNSKSLPISEQGFQTLTPKDKENVRNGIPNYIYAENNPLKTRLYKTFFEFEAFEHWNKVEGSSLIQRLELWHKTILLAERADRRWFGVGTGDLKGELNKQLEVSDSQLAGSGMRTHNQYLTVFATFGLIGFLVFCLWLFYPMFALRGNRNACYVCFFAIVLVSMFAEDTLDNQQGIMFFTLLNSFFLAWTSPCSKKVLPLQR